MMIARILFFWQFLSLFSVCTFAQTTTDEAQIRAVLEKQTLSWNSGNLKDFMNGYWQSDSLKFVGKSGIQYGYKATLQQYQKNYPTQESMGKLTFDIIEIQKQIPFMPL